MKVCQLIHIGLLSLDCLIKGNVNLKPSVGKEKFQHHVVLEDFFILNLSFPH
jgi:hypothetical protein